MSRKRMLASTSASMHRIGGFPRTPAIRFPISPILQLRFTQPTRRFPAGTMGTEMQSPLSAAERKTGNFPDQQPAHSVNQCREVRVRVSVSVSMGSIAALQVCGECEGDGLKTSERARRKRRVRSAESKIQSMEEQRLHGFGPLGSETHFVQHG